MSKSQISNPKPQTPDPKSQTQAVALGRQATVGGYEARFEDLRRTLHRLRRSTLSLVGLGIVLAIILMAIFAPQVARLFPVTGWLTAEDALSALQSGD